MSFIYLYHPSQTVTSLNDYADAITLHELEDIISELERRDVRLLFVSQVYSNEL